MVWHEIRVDSWKSLSEILVDFGQEWLDGMLYRGQSKEEWELQPKYRRIIHNSGLSPSQVAEACDSERMEQQMVEEFRRSAGRLGEASTVQNFEDPISWLFVMQHYGVPTRLLDWSRSPYVALYFAVRDAWEADGALWCFYETALSEDHKNIGSNGEAVLPKHIRDWEHFFFCRDTSPHVYVVDAPVCTDRMLAQQGSFTMCRNHLSGHGEGIGQSCKGDKRCCKIVISSKCKEEIFIHLKLMNVSSENLFPGIDGVGRTMDENLRVILRKVGTSGGQWTVI